MELFFADVLYLFVLFLYIFLWEEWSPAFIGMNYDRDDGRGGRTSVLSLWVSYFQYVLKVGRADQNSNERFIS